MEWVQFSIFILAVFGLFVWNRTESRADIRHMDTKLDAQRNLIMAIHDEMRDFHGRLERQDAEFKGRMEKQDAEFKAHLLYAHSGTVKNISPV